MKNDKYDLVVIGAGAAGMMAACTAAERGARVLLLEKNERPGKKLCITGKGRCNLTNHCSAEEVLRNVPRNGRFLYSCMNGFPPEKAMAFFEARGCAVKTERGNRVFPVSDRAQSVLRVLEDELARTGVELRQERAEKLLTDEQGIAAIRTDRTLIPARSVILCTGGRSYPATGSTGDGYRIAQALGHTILAPRGSLVPMVEDGDWCAQLQGLSLRNVQATLLDQNGKQLHSEFGELLFTHFGLSGPVILSMSAHMEPEEHCIVSINLKPALEEKQLDERIVRDFTKYRNRNLENALFDLFPSTLIPVMIRRSGIPAEQKVNSITKQQRKALADLTRHFTISVCGLRPVEEAIITCGGVKVSEVNPTTMESRLVPGLYFAGELLDVDGYTGGFNLQIAWATGYAAGTAAAKSSEEKAEKEQ